MTILTSNLQPVPRQTPRRSARTAFGTERMADAEPASTSAVGRERSSSSSRRGTSWRDFDAQYSHSQPESSNPHRRSGIRSGPTRNDPASEGDSGTDDMGALDGASTAFSPFMDVDHEEEELEGPALLDDGWTDANTFRTFLRSRSQGRPRRASERSRHEDAAGIDALSTLYDLPAQSMMLYNFDVPNPQANDVWPHFRNATKLPARYLLLRTDRPQQVNGLTAHNDLPKVRELLRPTDLPQRSGPGSRAIWPAGQLPTEIYEEIAGYLDRDDIKSMRLVSREFNNHVSQVIFKTVVVPFNTEIYGMLEAPNSDIRGKKKVRVEKPLSWKNATGNDVYDGHGLDVFRGFGHHILKFAMSFDVTEDALGKPPVKYKSERHTSFWGNYDWPYEEYRRFDSIAGLETAADETPRMTVAFSELSRVQELGLSVDSGLGWLNGPDRSIRARILPKSPEVFGDANRIPDRRTQAQRTLWEYIESCHPNNDVKLATLYRMETGRAFMERQGAPLASNQPAMPFLDPHLVQQAIPHDAADLQVPHSLDDQEDLESFVLPPSETGTGILYSSTRSPTPAGQLLSPIIPTNLTKAQKEWLLETEWAQRAFLSSYMLSVIDNPGIFGHIHNLNLSQISDRYLPMLNRRDFWDTLQKLERVTVQVIPGWRSVYKDEAAFVETPKIDPASGIDPFYALLRDMISNRANIHQLTIGWADGGEHAEGFHARNKHLLPAPLLPMDVVTEQFGPHINESLLRFPHVDCLTLKNCWITPDLLENLVREHDMLKLKSLTLYSVSLTAKLRAAPNGAQMNWANVFGALFVPPAGAHNPQVAFGQAAQAPGLAPAPGQAQAQAQILPPLNALNPFNINNQQNFVQLHIQTLQAQIQQLQAQGVAQVQPQLIQLQVQLQIQQQQLQLHQPGQPPQQGPQMIPPNPVGPNHNIGGFLAGLQAQLQQIVNLVQQQVPGAIAPPAANPQVTLRAEPRAGSWLSVLDVISPGLNLSDFGSTFSQADADRTTSLESIRFISCGYAKLPNAMTFLEQPGMDDAVRIGRSSLYMRKWAALAPAMLSAKWPLLGDIVQEVNQDELAALAAAWDLDTGWQDEEAAQGPEFDGLMPGGTGRFTGVVNKRALETEMEG